MAELLDVDSRPEVTSGTRMSSSNNYPAERAVRASCAILSVITTPWQSFGDLLVAYHLARQICFSEISRPMGSGHTSFFALAVRRSRLQLVVAASGQDLFRRSSAISDTMTCRLTISRPDAVHTTPEVGEVVDVIYGHPRAPGGGQPARERRALTTSAARGVTRHPCPHPSTTSTAGGLPASGQQRRGLCISGQQHGDYAQVFGAGDLSPSLFATRACSPRLPVSSLHCQTGPSSTPLHEAQMYITTVTNTHTTSRDP